MVDGVSEAQRLISALNLSPHPEGGWYRETWRAHTGQGERSGGTAILFLLEEGRRSHWHRVDATEIWFWHAGHPLLVSIAPDENAGAEHVRLGSNVLAGERPQGVVPANYWQAAHADRGWALVSCTVTPGFEFAGFTLAPPGWSPR